jgi:hypothetical protein
VSAKRKSRNARQPSRRVRKALAKYVKQQVALPKNWTKAEVRVDKKGEIQLRMNPEKLGSGTRFAKCVQAVTEKGGAYDPKAVCAKAGRTKYGKKRMQQWGQQGRKRARRK